MTSWLVAVLVTVAMSSAALAQGVPVNDSGLTARDLVETAGRSEGRRYPASRRDAHRLWRRRRTVT